MQNRNTGRFQTVTGRLILKGTLAESRMPDVQIFHSRGALPSRFTAQPVQKYMSSPSTSLAPPPIAFGRTPPPFSPQSRFRFPSSSIVPSFTRCPPPKSISPRRTVTHCLASPPERPLPRAFEFPLPKEARCCVRASSSSCKCEECLPHCVFRRIHFDTCKRRKVEFLTTSLPPADVGFPHLVSQIHYCRSQSELNFGPPIASPADEVRLGIFGGVGRKRGKRVHRGAADSLNWGNRSWCP